MTLTPQAAVALFYEAECRDFDGPIPSAVAVVDVASSSQDETSTTGAAGLSGLDPADERASLLHAAPVPAASSALKEINHAP